MERREGDNRQPVVQPLPAESPGTEMAGPQFWQTPPWATTGYLDEGYVVHRRFVGAICLEYEKEPLRIELARFDELTPAAERRADVEESTTVSIDGRLLNPAEARQLREFLDAALHLIS